MSRSQSNKNLLAEGIGLSGQTFSDTLAFNGQCFLLNAARVLQAAPEFFEGTAGDQREERVIHSPTLEPKATAYDAVHGDFVSGHRVAPALDHDDNPHTLPRRAGKLTRYNSSGERASPFGPIMVVQSTQDDNSFNHVVPNREANDILMQMTPAEISQLVPYIKLYKLEYGTKPNPYDPEHPLPDPTKAVEIEIKFDKSIEQYDVDDLLESGRLGGIGIKKFRWQLRGVNPAEADKNIEAQLEIHFNKVDQIFLDQFKQPSLKVEQGKASVLDLIVYSPPIGPPPPSPGEETGTEDSSASDALDPGNSGTPDPKNDHLIYDGKFFEIKAVVGWSIPPGFGGRSETGWWSSYRAQDISDKLKAVLYMQLTDHRFNFNQDGSADLIINYRARTTMKEMADDITGTAHRELLLDRIEKMKTEVKAETRESDDAELTEAEKEIENYSTTRYADLVKDVPKYIAWARPEQLNLFKKSGAGVKAASAKDFYYGMTGGTRSEMGQWHEEGGRSPGAPSGREQSKKGSHVGNITLAGDMETGIGIAPIGFGADYLNSTLNPLGTDEKIEKYFGLDYMEPLDNPWYPVARKGGSILPGRDSLSPEIAVNNMIGNIVPTDPANYSTDEEQKQQLRHTNSTVAVARGTKSGTLRRPGSGDVRGKNIPVVFFYLGDLLWSVIEKTPGVKQEMLLKNLAMMTLDIQMPDPVKFHKALKLHQAVPDNTLARKLKFGLESLSSREMLEKLYHLNIAAIPIQLDLFLSFLQQKLVKAGRDYYFFETFLIDLIRELINPVLGTACIPGLPRIDVAISCVSITVDKDSSLVVKGLPWSTATGWGRPSEQNPTRYVTSAARILKSAKIATDDMSTLSPHPNPPGLGWHSGAPAPQGDTGHTTFKILLGTTKYIRRPGLLRSDANSSTWHFRVGDNVGPVMKIAFNRTDIPMAREARTNRSRAADVWQLRELYNTSIKLIGFPGVIPGQIVYVTPNMHMFGDPRHQNSVARILGLGGYHIVVSTDSEITPNTYTTSIQALHEALPQPQDETTRAVVENGNVRWAEPGGD